MNFRTMLNKVDRGEVVAPMIRAALYDPDFTSFTVKVRGFKKRPPDSWFHPSTHPLWPARMLFYYLTAPERCVGEPFDPHSVMAVTQGHFWHDFIQHVGSSVGLFQVGPCPCGCKSTVERAFEDTETGARGHADGLLTEEVFEFKTIRPAKLHKFPDLVPEADDLAEWYRGYYPTYWAQGQEYMRLSGFRRHRTLLLAMDYPYEMREVVLDYDHAFARETHEKYRQVRQAAADLRPPMPCCAPASKESKDCTARLICPHGASS